MKSFFVSSFFFSTCLISLPSASRPFASHCATIWLCDAAFGFDLSVAPRDGATFELTATLDADFSTITAVFRHNEGHPSFATTDGALALAFEEEWDPG